MDDMMNHKSEDIGNIKIADEVVATVAGIATSEVAGVAGMSGTIAGGIAEILGKKNLGKGVKIEHNGDVISIDLHLIVVYGARVPEVAWEIQEKVKKAVESMTGLEVEKVNIFIEGVYIEKEPRKETKPPKKEELDETIMEEEALLDEDVPEA